MIRRRINIQSQLDAVNQAAAQALQSAQSAVAVSQGQATARPTKKPSVFWDFANSRFLDPRLVLQRNSPASYFDRNGNLQFSKSNSPRFTHDPLTGESLGLLYERTNRNFILYSENFNVSPWSSDSITLANGSLFWGKYQSTKISETPNITVDPRLMYSNLTLESGKKYTFSMFVRYLKGIEDRYLQTNFNLGFIQSPGAIFDLKNNAVIATNGLDNVKLRKLKNGIFKISYSTLESNGNTASLRIRPTIYTNSANIGAPVAYTTSSTASSFEIFGVQLEEGVTDSSYMKTEGNIFTRATDRLGVSGILFQEIFPNADFAKDGCTMFLSARRSKKRVDDYYPYFRFFSSAGNYFSVTDTPSGTIYPECWKDGIQKVNASNINLSEDENFKLVFALKPDDTAFFVNGSKLGSDLDVEMPSGISSFWIGDGISTIIKQFGFWPERLTDSESLAITTTNLSGKENNQLPTNSDLGSSAYVAVKDILKSTSRQHFTVDGTGASITRNIRFNYDFDFEIVDSSGCSITSQPSASCVANTDNALVFSAPPGKSLTYAVTPKFEY